MADLKKILYAEDEPDIQVIARMALETVGGFDVVICSSGQEAVERAPLEAPDLILLDVMMPGLDGPETLEKLRQIDSLKDTPVIFLTAKAMTTEIERFLQAGAIEVIAKPFDPMTISDQICKIWADHGY
jgi:CheY-like chemotaxis protein